MVRHVLFEEILVGNFVFDASNLLIAYFNSLLVKLSNLLAGSVMSCNVTGTLGPETVYCEMKSLGGTASEKFISNLYTKAKLIEKYILLSPLSSKGHEAKVVTGSQIVKTY